MIRMTRAELGLVSEALERKARRTGRRFVFDLSRIEVVDDTNTG